MSGSKHIFTSHPNRVLAEIFRELVNPLCTHTVSAADCVNLLRQTAPQALFKYTCSTPLEVVKGAVGIVPVFRNHT